MKPEHKLEFGVELSYRGVKSGHTLGDTVLITAYIEVDAPLDQTRVGGMPAVPWADEPRYAWQITTTNKLHIAGWLREKPSDNHPPSFRVVDVSMPWTNVIKLQVYRHDDWEGKPDDTRPTEAK